MQTQEEIRTDLRAMKPYLADEYGVSEIGIFGSYVRDEQDEDSDLDLLVEFDDSIGLLDFARLEDEL